MEGISKVALKKDKEGEKEGRRQENKEVMSSHLGKKFGLNIYLYEYLD